MRVLLCVGLSFTVFGVLADCCSAQTPTITSLSPRAVLPGQPTTVEIRGANLTGAKTLWTSCSAQAVIAESGNDKADRVSFVITAPSDTPAGIHGLRLVTDKGVTPLQFLVVDELATVSEQKDAGTPETAQKLELPVAVDGNLPNLGTRYYQFTAAEGQRLSFEVLSRRLGEALDPMIRLLDASGRELAFSDDAAGQCGDSQICYTFPAAGSYLLELRDVRYQGGNFRLRIGDFPCVSVAYPLAITRDQPATVQLAGMAAGELVPATVTAAKDAALAWLPVSLKRKDGVASGFSAVAVVDRPQFLEAEPNNTNEQANRIETTHDINGRLETPGDIDRYVFKATKDSSLVFAGITRTQGSPTDLVISILKADGSQLARVDDTGVNEGSVTVKFPEDGDYLLVAEDLSRRGGPDHAYRVAIVPAGPSFALSCSTDTLNVPAGGSVQVTVTATRTGYAGPIELAVTGLPEGVTASKSVIGPGRNDAMLTLTATKEVPAGAWSLVRLTGSGNEGALLSTAEFEGALKTRFTSLRYAPPQLIEEIGVGVTSPSQFRWQAEPATAVLGKQLSTTVKLLAERDAGFDDVIAIAIDPAKNGVPAGITVGVKNIDKGKNDVEIAVSADDKAALGDFTVGLLGTLKQDKTTVVQPLALRISIGAPLTVSGMVPAGAVLKTGGELELNVSVDRNPALKAPVEVTLANLPRGVTAPAATIPAGETTAKIKLTAAADAPVGAVNNIQVKATAAVEKAKFEATSPNLAVTGG